MLAIMQQPGMAVAAKALPCWVELLQTAERGTKDGYVPNNIPLDCVVALMDVAGAPPFLSHDHASCLVRI